MITNLNDSGISNFSHKLAAISNIITIEPQQRDGSRLASRSKQQVEQWL